LSESPAASAEPLIAFGAMPFGAGKMVHQPAWLVFGDPHPLETLAIPAALGDDAPSWA
jgi:hypothetical protein